MGSLPSSMRRRLHCYQAGVVVLIAIVLLSLMRSRLCSPGIFAIIAILLLPLPQWHCCRLQAGVVALITMASSPSSMRRHLCCCHDGIITLLALVLLPTLHRLCHPRFAGIVVLILLTSLLSRCMGVVTIIAPVLLPPLTWCVCAIALVSLPLSRWHCCPLCTGIVALVVQASLPLMCLHQAVNLQVSLPLLSWHVLSRGWHGRPRRQQWQHQRNKVNNASMTRAAMPAQWEPWCQHKPVQLMKPAWQEPMPVRWGQQCGRGGRRRHGVWVQIFKAAIVCQLTTHMDSISMCSNTLQMPKMNGWSSLSWLSASNMTQTHNFDSTTTSDPEPQNLSLLLWVKLCKAATVCQWIAYQCAQTLCECLIWMLEVIWGGCQPQPWHNDIILTPHVTRHPKFSAK